MKIKKGFVLRKVGKEQVVVTIGSAATLLNGLIKLNASGVVLWKKLEQGAERSELVDTLVNTYGISAAAAEADVEAFLQPLVKIGCIEG